MSLRVKLELYKSSSPVIENVSKWLTVDVWIRTQIFRPFITINPFRVFSLQSCSVQGVEAINIIGKPTGRMDEWIDRWKECMHIYTYDIINLCLQGLIFPPQTDKVPIPN